MNIIYFLAYGPLRVKTSEAWGLITILVV